MMKIMRVRIRIRMTEVVTKDPIPITIPIPIAKVPFSHLVTPSVAAKALALRYAIRASKVFLVWLDRP
jgi:hypothetical protein